MVIHSYFFKIFFFSVKSANYLISIDFKTIIQHNITHSIGIIFIKYFNKCLVKLLLKPIKP